MSLLEKLRHHLASADALLPLTLIGVASGLVTGLVIVAFRMVSEQALPSMGLMSHAERFEDLPPAARLVLPILGGLALGLIFQRASVGSRQVGIVHVMHCLAYHAGRLPWKNAVLQFFGGAVAIICGHSVGREGPVVHVGAASSSLLGQWFALPNNSIRILVACGTAASIGASFNTPVAGVIFAMEVVMMEYTLIGFAPVILAAVVATSISRAYFGHEVALDASLLQLSSLGELPLILVLGCLIGALAAGFNTAIFAIDRRFKQIRLWMRMTFAGAVVGVCAIWVPAVMGIGYDSLTQMLDGGFALAAVTALLALKFVATVTCVSLGIPGGLIAPTLVIGAAAGGALGIVAQTFAPGLSAQVPFYVLLGMGAMMGATLQAPLAALMAILELTSNPGVVLPGMLAIVCATVTARVAFKQESVFISMLKARGIEYKNDPVTIALERTGVGAIMLRRFVVIDRYASLAETETARSVHPSWILIAQGQLIVDVRSADEFGERWARVSTSRAEPDWLEGVEPSIDALPTVDPHATLREAILRMDTHGSDLVLISRAPFAAKQGVIGVLTREQIESSVRYRG